MALDFYIAESEEDIRTGEDSWRYGLNSDDHSRVVCRYSWHFEKTKQAKKIIDYLSDAVFTGKEIVIFMDELEEIKKELRDEWNKDVIERLIEVCQEALETNQQIFTICD